MDCTGNLSILSLWLLKIYIPIVTIFIASVTELMVNPFCFREDDSVHQIKETIENTI